MLGCSPNIYNVTSLGEEAVHATFRCACYIHKYSEVSVMTCLLGRKYAFFAGEGVVYRPTAQCYRRWQPNVTSSFVY